MNKKGNIQNLKPFKPGQSGNPKGRPKKELCLTDILREQANIEDVETLQGKIKRKHAIANKLWELAMSGDVAALKYLYDRVDGRPIETVKQDLVVEDRSLQVEYIGPEVKGNK